MSRLVQAPGIKVVANFLFSTGKHPCGYVSRVVVSPRERKRPVYLEMKLTAGDISRAFETPTNTFGPILSLKEAACLSKLAPSTLKRLVSEGRFADCVKRGKPLLFWRDRFVAELMK